MTWRDLTSGRVDNGHFLPHSPAHHTQLPPRVCVCVCAGWLFSMAFNSKWLDPWSLWLAPCLLGFPIRHLGTPAGAFGWSFLSSLLMSLKCAEKFRQKQESDYCIFPWGTVWSVCGCESSSCPPPHPSLLNIFQGDLQRNPKIISTMKIYFNFASVKHREMKAIWNEKS